MKCPEHGVLVAAVPWAYHDSGFTVFCKSKFPTWDKVNEMEAQIKEHDLEMSRQETALKVSSWITNEVPLQDDETKPVMIANYTNLPIYDVIDAVDDKGAYHMDQSSFAAYTHFVPPGCYYIYASWHGG